MPFPKLFSTAGFSQPTTTIIVADAGRDTTSGFIPAGNCGTPQSQHPQSPHILQEQVLSSPQTTNISAPLLHAFPHRMGTLPIQIPSLAIAAATQETES
jgi:hypothetical protein